MKKGLLLFTIGFIVMALYFYSGVPKDEMEEIQMVVMGLEHPMLEVAHIEWLEENKALAFYEWGHGEELSFGNVLLEKKFLGWEMVLGGSLYVLDDTNLNWGHLDLSDHLSNYTDLLRGQITDPKIEELQVITKFGKEHQPTVINYNNNKRFWFLITDGEELLDATVLGFSSDRKIIEEIETSY
ncbi:hypothetical protein [Alkalihalobacillus sp. 1P02AB]|uniref:hypothetical protein n=1 Tax=Alkalihalobacillus sp. 1P02AB TaxID=3132260 RepID=UPI0039A4A174